MQSIAVETTLTLEDWRALRVAAARRLRGASRAPSQWSMIVIVAAATTGAIYLVSTRAVAFDPWSLVVGAAVALATVIVSSRLALRRAKPLEGGTFLGACTYELDEHGLRASRARSSSYASWRAVIDVTHTEAYVFVWVDRLAAYAIPARDLPEGLTAAALAGQIAAARAQVAPPGDRIGLATGAPAADPSLAAANAPAPTHAPSASALTHAPRAFLARLADFASLAGLRGKPVLTDSSHELAAALTTLLAVGTWTLFDRAENGPDAEFFAYGVADIAWYLLGGLAVAWVLARLSTPRVALARTIVVCALGAWLAILFLNLAPYSSVNRWIVIGTWIAAVLYGFAYLSQGVRALTGRAQTGALLAAYGAIALLFWSVNALVVYPTAWMPGGSDDEDYAISYRTAEPLLFAQRDRLDAALAAVPPSDPDKTELFFVGFAGYGGQKVFAEEIKFAARVVAERYAQDVGSLLLINDVRDVESAPLATASTLRYALHGVAAKMTLDDDVLFLALSSHGSHDWELTVANGSLPLADLTPEDLAAALDDAGIEWRVIVISACYAGGFIDALRSPKTIVLAAAAPDRTSFGCSDERDLTYFGEAFYRDALPGAASLREAFASAEAVVAEHESAEGVTRASQPMAFFGDELERKLAAIE